MDVLDTGRESKKYAVYGLLALGFMYGFFFCLYAGDIFLPNALSAPEQRFVCRISILLSTAAALLFYRSTLMTKIWGRFATPSVSRVFDVVTMLCMLAPVCAFVTVSVRGFSAAVVILWAIGGLSCARLYLHASLLLCSAGRGKTISFMASSTLMAGLLFLTVSLLPSPCGIVFATMFPFSSVIFYRIRKLKLQYRVEKSLQDDDGRYARPAWDAILFTLVACIGQGLGLSFLLVSVAQPEMPIGDAVAGIAWCLASFLLIVDQRMRRFIDEERSIRYLYLEIFVPLVIVLPLRSPLLLVAGGSLVLMTWMTLVIGASSEAETANMESLIAERALSRGWVLSMLGMSIGMGIGYFGIEAAGSDLIPFVMMIACAGATLLAVVSFISRPLSSRRAFRLSGQEARYSEERGGNHRVSLGAHTVSEDGLARECLGSRGEGEGTPLGAAGRRGDGPFKRKCNRIANRSGLSPRQREVFMLLVHGRNRKYIQDSLVISRGTADTHIYNIYRKLNVHSRQELIDLVEEYELSD